MKRTTSGAPLRVRVAGPEPGRPGGVSAHLRALLPALGRREDVAVELVPTGRRPGELQGVRAVVRDAAAVARGEVDLLHLNPSLRTRALARDGWLAALAATRAPVVVHLHGWDAALAARIDASPRLQAVLRATLGRRAVLAVSPDALPALQRWGIEAEQLGPAVDLDALPTRRRPRSGRILFLGRLERAKGVFHLLDAFARLTDDHPDATLVLAGDGSERKALLSAVRARGMTDRVFLPGWVEGEEHAHQLAQAAVVALPSSSEACPLAVLEAVAVGCPVVATPVGCVPDVVPAAALGSAEPGRLADRLSAALSEPVTGDAAAVRLDHAPDRVAERLVAVWRRVAS